MSWPILELSLEVGKVCETKPTERSRKRTRNPEKHKNVQQKNKVQKGLEYETKSGKIVKAKIFCEQTMCDCKNKCTEKINVIRPHPAYIHIYAYI